MGMKLRLAIPSFGGKGADLGKSSPQKSRHPRTMGPIYGKIALTRFRNIFARRCLETYEEPD